MPAPRFFDSFAAVLDRLAPRLGLETKLWEMRLQQRWPAIVGERIAAHTHPERIWFKKLYVLVESSVWSQQLLFLKRDLLQKIGQATESHLVEDLIFRVGVIPAHDAETTSRKLETPPLPDPSPETLADAAAHAAVVADPELRARLTEVIARSLAQAPRPLEGDRSRVP
ncbi:MAG: DUF721 domain-containing protein [Nitrospirae bacterium]|nr:DUF721 domain-containing protein [Nitrospirota bacterium]